MRPFRWLHRFAACGILLALVAPGATMAEDSPDEPRRRAPQVKHVRGETVATPVANGAGMVIVRDEATGELRAPTPEERAAMRLSVDPLYRSDAGLIETHRADGTVSVVVGDRFLSTTVLRRDADTGEHSTICVHDAETTTARALSGANEDASDDR